MFEKQKIIHFETKRIFFAYVQELQDTGTQYQKNNKKNDISHMF